LLEQRIGAHGGEDGGVEAMLLNMLAQAHNSHSVIVTRSSLVARRRTLRVP
jgi:hypothetical protein